LVLGYSHAFTINSLILRPANIIGSNATHGVILDFLRKLSENKTRLEILGDGSQRKSYLHVSDFIEALFYAFKNMIETRGQDVLFDILNVGNSDATSVDEIAKIICESLNLSSVKIIHKPNFEGRGWVGDVKYMLLDVTRLLSIGWKPSMNSNDSVKKAVLELHSEI
jgi:UDP-glucose 4-epimerase